MNHNKLTLIIFFIAYPIYLDISIEEDVNLIAAIVTDIWNENIDIQIEGSSRFDNIFLRFTR